MLPCGCGGGLLAPGGLIFIEVMVLCGLMHGRDWSLCDGYLWDGVFVMLNIKCIEMKEFMIKDHFSGLAHRNKLVCFQSENE